MKRVLLIGVALLFLTPLPARALPVLDFQIGANYVDPTTDIPHGDVDDAYDSGFGAYARLRSPIGPGLLAGAVTWNNFSGKGSVDDLDFLTFQVGPHFSIAMVSAGLELAWLGEFEEVGISPMLSVAVLKFEGTVAYTTGFDSDSPNWMSLGVGWRF